MVFVLIRQADAGAGQPSSAAKLKKNTPVVITARSMFADNKKKVVIYTTNVVVKKDDITLWANKVIINLVKSGEDKPKAAGAAEPVQGSGKIDTIEAVGNVKVVQQDKTATSDEATYYSATDKIVMTGHPRVWQGDNVLNGRKIIYNIKEDTFDVDEADTVLYQSEGASGKAAGTSSPAKGK